MFTGLVEELGEIASMQRRGVDCTLRVRSPLRDYVLGESIAVNGACLSVTRWGDDWFDADATAETLAKTSLGELLTGSRVHLERALRHDQRLGGHLVSGHVDGVGRVEAREPLGDAVRTTFAVPPELAPFLAPKGSITIDGVSLTVNAASGTTFDVVLVPITRTKTLLEQRPLGGRVNLEVDVLAKYVARLLGRPGVDGRPAENPTTTTSGGVTLDLLTRQGYLSPASK